MHRIYLYHYTPPENHLMYPIIRQDIALSTTLVSQHHEAEFKRLWSNASDISGHGEAALLLALPSFVVPNSPKSKPICKMFKRNHLNMGWDGKEAQTSGSRRFPFVPHARIRNNVETEVSSAWPRERKEANLCPDWRESHGRAWAYLGLSCGALGLHFKLGVERRTAVSCILCACSEASDGMCFCARD